LNDTTLVVLCAGESSRFSLKPKKQWLRIDDQPLWLNVTNRLSTYSDFEKIIVVGHQSEVDYMENFSRSFEYVAGGSTRQQSIGNALQKVTSKYVMITDVARCCVPESVIEDLITNKQKASCIIPVLNVADTVIYNGDTIDRDNVKLIQTPQLSKTDILKKALDQKEEFTDDSSAIKALGESVYYIKGSTQSKKLTFGDEIDDIVCLQSPSKDFFTGFGIDIHQFEQNKQMVLGGVSIDAPFGFKAHSDGDVLIHSIIDALLGASGAGDIGEFFPDNDPQYKNADSKELLKSIVKFINNVGYEIINIDLTILAEIPKINPHKKRIKYSLADLMHLPAYKINIKATTSEKMGFVGRKEGVTVYSVATLKYYDWKSKK
jgi:2-C-methyl-D-erythritol 4-phosphate cytidylyltransferase/2-C-methyl-D-erythritol 2,4-cyclodiphosphate synthase